MISTFKVIAPDQDQAEPSTLRSQRRAHLSPDVLRTYKLSAGQWVYLKPLDSDDAGIVVQLWPRTGLSDDGASQPNYLACC
jgi:AAA family ATPase